MPSSAPHVSSSSVGVLAEILRPDVNLCVWERCLPHELDTWLHVSAMTNGFEASVALASRELGVASLVAPLPASPHRDALLADLGALVRLFFEIAARPIVAQLAVVEDDSCRKMHVDEIGLRLLVTYGGPGTEWAPNDAVDRAALGRRYTDLETANRAIVPDASRLRRARTGDVLLMKGSRFRPAAIEALVHRSPPIARTGARRLVFRITSGSGELS
jgi:hypothetical protein